MEGKVFFRGYAGNLFQGKPVTIHNSPLNFHGRPYGRSRTFDWRCAGIIIGVYA